ncbi:MAG TPA: glycosyltransferase [Vicinamibacterales bacterium]
MATTLLTRPSSASVASTGILSRVLAGASRETGNPRALAHGLSVVICTRRRPRSLARCLDGIAASSLRPNRLFVIDASPDRETELHVAYRADLEALAGGVEYVRVARNLAGLTRQRNFALDLIATDAVAFFDDDVVLGEGCLAEMEQVLRSDARIVGVGAVAPTESGAPGRLHRVRRVLGIVDGLTPGRYCRSGMSIAWRGLDRGRPVVDVEWLPGYAMLWRTADAREVRFDEGFAGYANGEDLDFGLRMSRRGRLVIATHASLRHEHVAAGRPDPYRLGRMTVENAWVIQHRALPARTWRDTARFAWAFGVDTIVQTAALASPPGPSWRIAHARGRLASLVRLLAGNGQQRPLVY